MVQRMGDLVAGKDNVLLTLHLSSVGMRGTRFAGGDGYRARRFPRVWSSFWMTKVEVLGILVSGVTVTLLARKEGGKLCTLVRTC